MSSESKSIFENPATTIAPKKSDQVIIEISNLRMTFNGTDFVLNGINLKIPRGQVTFIIGFSGAGKSVLLKLILGLLKPTSGSIKVLGQEISTMNDEQLLKLRCHYGMVFQDSALFDDLSALENVLFPLREHRRDLTEPQMITIAQERLKAVGFESIHDDKLPSQMSGGMRKRVGVARALALDPEILIYDEPTTGLDPVLTEVVDKLIMTSEKLKSGITSLVVSHDLHAAFKMADQVAMLDSGRIALCGTPKEFMDSKIGLIKKFVSSGMFQKH